MASSRSGAFPFLLVWVIAVFAQVTSVFADCLLIPRPFTCRHTHFGCDQVFSCHAKYLRKNDAKTLPQLVAALVASYESTGEGRVKVILLEKAADVRGWLEGHLDPNLRRHTTGHQYVFERKSHEGREDTVMTVMQYSISKRRNWACFGPVLQVSGPTVLFTKSSFTVAACVMAKLA